MEGVITIASLELVSTALERADQLDSPAVVLLIETPGGTWDATQDIIRLIETSNTPVIAYVYPVGATAWSAGTYIVVSSHIAVMAPFSIIGSSQPRMFPSGETVEDPKALNAFAEYIIQRAKMHGRNATLAEEFVRTNRNVGAEEALELGIIEAVSPSIEQLLADIDGMNVSLSTGYTILNTVNAEVHYHKPSIRNRILFLIADPNVAYILFTVGVYVLVFGLATVGLTGETIGAIMLILGLIGLGFYVDLLTIGLLVLGAVFIYLEIRDPAAEVFGPAGIFSLIIGSLLMLRLNPEDWLVSLQWYRVFMITAILLVITLSGLALYILYTVIRAVKRKPSALTFEGNEATTIDELGPDKIGYVRFHGELWKARSEKPVKAGEKVEVTGKENLVLTVEPMKHNQPDSNRE
jgi:membrane-bound serine protease (ClpP class)